MNSFTVNERTTQILTFQLKDENGTAIDSGALGTFQLTLYNFSDPSDTYHLATINHRYLQNVLGTHNVAITATCHCTWTLQAADNQILNTNKSKEHHIALFEFYYGGKRGNSEIHFFVNNLNFVT